MHFVMLTAENGKPLIVNLDCVASITVDEAAGVTWLNFPAVASTAGGQSVLRDFVKETPEEIFRAPKIEPGPDTRLHKPRVRVPAKAA